MEKYLYEAVDTKDVVITNAKERNNKSSWMPLLRQIFICSGVCNGYFIIGVYTGVPAVLVPQLRKEANSTEAVSEEEVSWMSSVGILAALPYYVLPLISGRVGRKYPFIGISIIMPFKRDWDESCPLIYDQWESDGVSYVIQDLPPEDEDAAIKLLVEDFLPDEPICSHSGIHEDPVSLNSIVQSWRLFFNQRTSLACYATKDGHRTLVACNACAVLCEGEKAEIPMEGEGWINVYNVCKYFDERLDAFKYLGLDQLLYALGLIVQREYRGAGLGARVLAAREPLCRKLGVKGSSTLFTGPGSQKSAARAGFHTAYEATWTELADAGLNYTRDGKVIKLMVRKYD
ncbi:hypothetical protein NE865_08764 [Phthorimaea operculella]|nr:hypothetical protein NE865_08764 [Phthorimaea operculella]